MKLDKIHENKNLLNWVMLVIFISCAILAQQHNLQLLFGIKFEFVSVFALAIIRLFGLRKALFSAVIIFTFGYFNQINSIFHYLIILEVLIVGSLYHWKKKDLLIWDLLFWTVACVPYYFLELNNSIEGVASLILFQVMINAIINALTADIISDYLPHMPFINKVISKKEKLYFGRIILQIIIVAAVIPMLCFTIINSWYNWNEIKTEASNDIRSVSQQIDEKIHALDRQELQFLKLESIVQKAFLKEMFDNYTDQSNMSIYAVDKEDRVIVSSGGPSDSKQTLELLNDGFVTQINNDSTLWLPKQRNQFENWSTGYFLSTLNVENLEIFILIPIKEQFLLVSKAYSTYFMVILLLFVLAFGFAWLCKKILSGSLLSLTKMTSNLPKRMDNNQQFTYSRRRIHEFDSLEQNFQDAANKLRQMFQESQRTNSLLLKRTEELSTTKDELFNLAHFDNLTKLPNRNSFYQDVTNVLEISKAKNLNFAIVFIDLDEFKQVNDEVGHDGGDLLLKSVAERMTKLRGNNASITFYRLGGDEFIIILRNTNANETESFCLELLERIKVPFTIHGKAFTLTASMGVSCYPQNGEDIEKMIINADTAMYELKQSGRDGVKFFKA